MVARARGNEGVPRPELDRIALRRAQDAAAELRAAGQMLRRCAWCCAVTLGPDGWARPEDEREIAYLDELDVVTHGICPDCFDAEINRLDAG
jgi:hypothetical protein